MAWEPDNSNVDNTSPVPPQSPGARSIDQSITDAEGHQWIRREQAAGHAHAQSLTCPECEGEMIWATLISSYRIAITGLDQQGRIGKNSTGIASLVCTNCGFTKFYTIDPRKLLE